MGINIDHFDLTGRRAMLIGAKTHAGGAIAAALDEAGAKRFNTNVLNSEDIRASVHSAVEELGGLDILVSCPELFLAKPIGDTSDSDLHLIMEYNFFAQYSAVRAAVDVMQENEAGGNIILLTHVLGERGLPNTSAYGSAQAATQNLIRHMAQEVGRDKITINGISLGWMDWMSDRIDPTDEEAARAIRFTIAKRAGEPADIGPMAVWLSGTGVGYVTGQIFAVDGGLLQHL